MLSRLKFTAKSTAIYALGSVGTKLIGLILLPIYTDKLSTDQYGMWSVLEITSQILVLSFGLRMSTAMLRFYAGEKEKSGKAKIVFTSLWATFLSIVIFNLISHPFSNTLSSLFFDTHEFSTYFHLLFIWTSFEIMNKLILDLIRIKEKPGFYISATITKFVIVLLLNIYFIVFRDMGIDGIILAQLIGSIIFVLFTLRFMIKETIWAIDFSVFKEMFRYSFPLIFSGISTFILSVGDRYLLKIFMNYHEVGIYSISYKISTVIKIVLVQAFQLGFLPIAFNMYDKPNAKRFFSKIFTYYVFILFWAGLAVSLFAKEIIYTFSSDVSYYEAYKYVPLITLAMCFFGMQSFFAIGIHYAKKTKKIAGIIFIALLINIGSNILLIPRLGLYGAAISYLIAGILMTSMNYIESQKHYRIKFEGKKILIIVVFSILVYCTSIFINDINLALRIVLKLLLILAFPIVLYFLKFYDPVEIEKIIGIWRKWRNPKYWYRNLKEISFKQSMDASDI